MLDEYLRMHVSSTVDMGERGRRRSASCSGVRGGGGASAGWHDRRGVIGAAADPKGSGAKDGTGALRVTRGTGGGAA
ncbi:MAG: hypothetical protein R3B49_01670 [Phycisphaerales bacterium]